LPINSTGDSNTHRPLSSPVSITVSRSGIDGNDRGNGDHKSGAIADPEVQEHKLFTPSTDGCRRGAIMMRRCRNVESTEIAHSSEPNARSIYWTLDGAIVGDSILSATSHATFPNQGVAEHEPFMLSMGGCRRDATFGNIQWRYWRE
jgi:hypothetical protein